MNNPVLNQRAGKLLIGLLLPLLLFACQKNSVTPLTPEAAQAAYQSNPASFLDVRTQEEWNAGHLLDVQHIPLDQLEQSISQLFPDKNQSIVSYCRSGRRANKAAEILHNMGYTKVSVIVPGGYAELRQAGFPVEER